MGKEKMNYGGQAFACAASDGQRNHLQEGMTLRDYFAAKSITGVCMEIWSNGDNHAPEYAKRAYQLADAMIKAREE